MTNGYDLESEIPAAPQSAAFCVPNLPKTKTFFNLAGNGIRRMGSLPKYQSRADAADMGLGQRLDQSK
ncbi:MAG: hypothetical protein MUQ60_00245, partial [Porticoccaceae bacterium]|nr:hypothetical protein [Porticoccaceae bacterium]